MRNAACPRIFSSKSHPTVLLQMAATILAVGAMVSLGACGGGAGASAAPPAPKPSPAGAGNLAASPTTISFANVAIGQTAMQQVTFTNQGTVQITVQTAVVSGAGLSVTGLTTPLSIAALQTASFEIQFIPLAVGNVTGSLAVTSDAADPALTIQLSGTGTSQPIPHSADLAWTASTQSVAGYNVYRGSQTGGPYSKINMSLVSGTAYTDSTVVAGQTYFYVVSAVDAKGNESPFSNGSQAIIPTP